jgi:hypothetical protein
MRGMRRVAIGLVALGAWLVPASAAQAAAAPAWQLTLLALPTNLTPGTTGNNTQAPMYELVATNVGAGTEDGPVTLTTTLPEGIVPIFNTDLPEGIRADTSVPAPVCSKTPLQTVTCTTTSAVPPSYWVAARIPVKVSSSLIPGAPLPEATGSVTSPGAGTVTTSAPTVISNSPPPFDFLAGRAGLGTLFTEEDGSASLAAGSHPDQTTIDLGFPVEQPPGSKLTTSAGHPRDIVTDFPPGLVINPNASGARCAEAEFVAFECPAEAQIGVITVTTEISGPRPVSSALYNMVPPPGSAAEVAFNVGDVGIFAHLTGGVRTDSDYRLYAESADTLARGQSPVEHVQAQIWGNPSAENHDRIRGTDVDRLDTPLLTMPSACSERLTTEAHARSWEEAEEGIPDLRHHTSAQATTTSGTPTAVSQCSALKFNPTLTVKPDTNAAESPAGFDIELQVPQHETFTDELGNRIPATSNVRDVTVTFPEGVALNPAAADGLKACTPGEIGMTTGVGQTPPHFDLNRPRCPEASKIGTVEVRTPLLDHSLSGAVYVAQPFQNPFGTLLGAYVVIDSPQDGLVAKLAGKTETDPNTGRLTVSFAENPQLPFSSFKVSLSGGPRAALRTPAICGTHTTTSVQVPWSGNAPANTVDSFQVTRGAKGGACVGSEAGMPNHPGFEAGTATPVAAAYSPFLGRLTRDDGEQQLKKLSASLPPGLTGKLAGVSVCPDAALVAAAAKSGAEELASPSCPASSLIGEVKVGAGAGPTPYYTTGKIYLAGPYKGAPISGVAVTPAVAGPFDLGTVVVRAPTYVNPITAQISLKSDDFPHILKGIPLELRDARLSLDRSEFTLNPSSCDPMAISGEAVSLLGQSTPLYERFQVAGCRGLDFGPKLFLRLKGGTKRGAHPKLRAVLEASPGEEANMARASVALPRSEFLENAHIRTVCTRVQFAAKQCPAGAIYGHAKVITPLFDEPIVGPIYLRSSSHELPDMVVALHGPADKPVEVELSGRIDSVNGGIRTTFDLVPDQPVKRAIFYFNGGSRGLLVNSRNVCKRTYYATAKFDGQNGKTFDSQPKLAASCGKKKDKERQGRSR